MGQKANPVAMRVAVNRDWRSKWYAEKREFPQLLLEDVKVRDFVKKRLEAAAVPKVLIERYANRVRITVFTARPGIVIGRKGSEIDKLKEELAVMTSKEIYVDIVEVKQPETDAQLVAENVALQLERRISYRRAMKKAVQTAISMGTMGIRINCGGRLGGSEIARREWYREGKLPLHNLRADIDYGFAEANTVYGKIGVKVWVCKGIAEPQARITQPATTSSTAAPTEAAVSAAGEGTEQPQTA
jgi:small subunit ribosomal protein S3